MKKQRLMIFNMREVSQCLHSKNSSKQLRIQFFGSHLTMDRERQLSIHTGGTNLEIGVETDDNSVSYFNVKRIRWDKHEGIPLSEILIDCRTVIEKDRLIAIYKRNADKTALSRLATSSKD